MKAQSRIFATCDIGSDALRRLTERGYQLEVYPLPDAPPRSLILDRVRSGIAALISTLRDPIDAEILEAGAGTLRVVGQCAVGFDNIDRAAASRLRIPFTHTPDVLTDATAEFALFMMGCLARRLYSSERLVRDNLWRAWHPHLPFLGDEVSRGTLAVIGAGRIGRALAAKCTSLDMDILCHTRSPRPEFAAALQNLMDLKHRSGLAARRCRFQYVSLQQALRAADFVSLHVPLTEATRHLIRRETLALMKPTAFLINTSRGAVVDEAALVEALRQGRIAGAALDVFQQEPLPADSPLKDPELEPRLRLFHHFASGGRRTRLSPDPQEGMAGRCVQSVLDVLEAGERDLASIPFVVNREAFQAGP